MKTIEVCHEFNIKMLDNKTAKEIDIVEEVDVDLFYDNEIKIRVDVKSIVIDTIDRLSAIAEGKTKDFLFAAKINFESLGRFD